MANAMETARNEGIPALPPLQRVTPVVHMPDKGDGQNGPSASDLSAIGASTTPTPPQQILVQAGSAILSITNAATSSSGDAANRDDANNTPRKQPEGSSRNSSFVASRRVTIVVVGIPGRTRLRRRVIDAVRHRRGQRQGSTTTIPSSQRTCRGIG